MYKELHEIATVIAGYTFRGAITPDANGDLYVFQAKDLVRNETVQDVNALTKISSNIPGYAGHLERNDVLLVARGMKAGAFRATVFEAEDKNVIASSSIHVIRVTKEGVLPEYVSHYLNSRQGQEALAEIVTGSYIGALPRKALEKLKIPIPHFKKQQMLIDLYQNIREQQKIISQQNEIKQRIVSETLKNLTNA